MTSAVQQTGSSAFQTPGRRRLVGPAELRPTRKEPTPVPTREPTLPRPRFGFLFGSKIVVPAVSRSTSVLLGNFIHCSSRRQSRSELRHRIISKRPSPSSITKQHQHHTKQQTTATMAGSALRKGYLVLYNAASAVAWATILGRVASVYFAKGAPFVPLVVDDFARVTQTFAVMEIFHALTGMPAIDILSTRPRPRPRPPPPPLLFSPLPVRNKETNFRCSKK